MTAIMRQAAKTLNIITEDSWEIDGAYVTNQANVTDQIWASMPQKLSTGFLTKRDSGQSP